MRLVLVGPPGAGKGTQASVLAEQLGVPHISSGDLFRAHIKGGTELGKQVSSILDEGKLVPDDVTNEMVRERLAEPDAAKGFILDGFPRNTGQADVLAGILAKQDAKVEFVLQFEVPDEELIARLLERGRTDDTEAVIRERQAIYRSETAPLLEYYSDILVTIDAVGDVEEITKRALDALRGR
ncbi:adenylate kinase [Sciscionella marina]|uniref:adenylate kinase n=1 Tax=Sciscionella marina TaxID=508770 RepID=UPI00037FDB23|nr:adenylate kinase [Sciscionella marina]